MMEQCAVNKPSRSDLVLDAEQQTILTNQIRAQFDSIAPKRPLKPNRSESDSSPQIPPESFSDDPIPEFHKFRFLQSHDPLRMCLGEGDSMIQEEYVETEYYKDLDSIDKQHYKTGSGFIQVVNKGDGDHELFAGIQSGANQNGVCYRGYRSNPATNEWLPNTDYQIFNSQKPNRSEPF